MFGADGTLESVRQVGLETLINHWQTESGRSGHRRVIVSSSLDWREREECFFGAVNTVAGKERRAYSPTKYQLIFHTQSEPKFDTSAQPNLPLFTFLIIKDRVQHSLLQDLHYISFNFSLCQLRNPWF
jgi:hypothetical protein